MPDFVCHRHADMFARRNCRLRDRVRVLERIADDAEVRATGAAELAQLSFFRTAGRAVHVGGLYGMGAAKFSVSDAIGPISPIGLISSARDKIHPLLPEDLP